MTTFPATGSLDSLGRLVHEDDAAAQLALSMASLEARVTAAGFQLADLTRLRVLATDRPLIEDVLDVLTERLTVLGLTPETVVTDVASLPVPGMLVALEGELGEPATPDSEPNPPQKEAP